MVVHLDSDNQGFAKLNIDDNRQTPVKYGVRGIPIEERSARELSHMTGRTENGDLATVQILPEGSAGANPAFDVTPNRYVAGIITEYGVPTAPFEENLRALAAKAKK